MPKIGVVILLLCIAGAAQESAPIRSSQISRKPLLQNAKVTVNVLELAPGKSAQMHQHDRDLLTVFVDGGQIRHTLFGKKPVTQKFSQGEVEFHSTGFSHAVTNTGSGTFRAVNVEFADPQGKLVKDSGDSKTCNPEKTACVDEKKLFCLAKVCVEDVVMAPGSSSIRHSHATDHMLIAVSDYELTDEVEGKGTVKRALKSGQVEYIPAGITHKLTNTGKGPAHFTVIVWR